MSLTVKRTRERMTAAREDAAGQLLEWDAVVRTIGEAAGKGYGLAVFGPPPGVNIKTTDAAAGIIERLHAAGFRTEWRDRRDPGDVLTFELAVGWEATPIGSD